VEICEWSGGNCAGSLVARFSITPTGNDFPLVVDTVSGEYRATWSLTSDIARRRSTYRIRVLSRGEELGATWVDAARGEGLARTSRTRLGWAPRSDGKAAPLVSAKAVPIRFWIARPRVVTAAETRVSQALANAYAAPQSATAASSLLASIEALFRELPPQEAITAYIAARDLALSGVAGERLRSLQATLAHVHMARRDATANSVNTDPTVGARRIIYINGVDTDPGTAFMTSATIGLLALGAAPFGLGWSAEHNDLDLVYNPTETFLSDIRESVESIDAIIRGIPRTQIAAAAATNRSVRRRD
jgi:hypothetical protein